MMPGKSGEGRAEQISLVAGVVLGRTPSVPVQSRTLH